MFKKLFYISVLVVVTAGLAAYLYWENMTTYFVEKYVFSAEAFDDELEQLKTQTEVIYENFENEIKIRRIKQETLQRGTALFQKAMDYSVTRKAASQTLRKALNKYKKEIFRVMPDKVDRRKTELILNNFLNAMETGKIDGKEIKLIGESVQKAISDNRLNLKEINDILTKMNDTASN